MTVSNSRPPRQARGRIPEFASIQEEAAWWDSHDIADYGAELRPVQVRVARRLSDGITIRLDADALTALRTRAQQTGVAPATLARRWLLDHLREGDSPSAAASG